MAEKRTSAIYEAPVWVMAALPANGLVAGSAATGSRPAVVGVSTGTGFAGWGRAVAAMPATSPAATPTLSPSATRRLLLIATPPVSTAM